MTIDLANLPDEGEHFSGELPPEIFELKKSDILSTGPLRYSLFAQRFESELLITGELEATFELTCQRSLHGFKQTVFVPAAAISLKIGTDSLLDVTEGIREEILLELPTIPRCEEGDDPGTCEIDPRYLAVDKSPVPGVDNAPTREKPNPWAALDALDSQD